MKFVFCSLAVGNPGVSLHSLSGSALIYPYRKLLLLMFNPGCDESQDHSRVMLAVLT